MKTRLQAGTRSTGPDYFRLHLVIRYPVMQIVESSHSVIKSMSSEYIGLIVLTTNQLLDNHVHRSYNYISSRMQRFIAGIELSLLPNLKML